VSGFADFEVDRTPEAESLTKKWNIAYRKFLQGDYDYLVISNNDVIFMDGWEEPLKAAFEDPKCGISGPMTNQPGHQPYQKIPIDDPLNFINFSNERSPSGNGYLVNFVNGFCFMLKRDRVAPIEDGVLFDEATESYGNEDEYQKRMRKKFPHAYAMEDSRAFHFKDVTMESWRDGRIPFHSLPKRITEEAS
jgi:GT2 family glycosyltransferase